MTKQLVVLLDRHVPARAEAMKALDRMERQLTNKKTYTEINKTIRDAMALKVLLGHVEEVKVKAEDVILAASARIGEELKKVPKAAGRPSKEIGPRAGTNLAGRQSTGVPKQSRSRLMKLADAGQKAVKQAADALREQGKDATPRAVATLITQGDKAERRATRELELGKKQLALPMAKFGVIYADPPWKFEPWSKETGMDRAADNHYPTQGTEEIMKIDVPSIAAPDCVLFLWATAPMLPHALGVMAAWGFEYKSHFVWNKDKIGMGYWNRNKHELLLIGTRGKIPCPALGEQYASVIDADVREHSEKPAIFMEMIEYHFPTLPKIELHCRGNARVGWEAWGNEACDNSAAGLNGGTHVSEAKATKEQIEQDFQHFWEAYPKRSGPNPKKPAFEKFKGHIVKGRATAAEMIAGAERYAVNVSDKDPQFIAQTQTWLNQMRWQDSDWAAPAGSCMTVVEELEREVNGQRSDGGSRGQQPIIDAESDHRHD